MQAKLYKYRYCYWPREYQLKYSNQKYVALWVPFARLCSDLEDLCRRISSIIVIIVIIVIIIIIINVSF